MSTAGTGEPPAESGRSTRRGRVVGILCAISVVLLFSSFILVSRLGFASSLELVDIAALRFVIAGVLMTPVLLHYGLSGVRWRDAAALAFSGGLAFALLAYTGLSLAPASHGAVLLHGTLPPFTFVLGWVATSPAVGIRRALGLYGIFIGILAMAVESVSGNSQRQLLGDGALLLASMSWSAYGLLTRRLGLAPAHCASIVAVFSMCCYLPFYLVAPGKAIHLAPWQDLVLQGIFQGVLIGALSLLIYARAVATLGAVETALFTAAVPCVTTLSAVFLLGEVPSAMASSGVLIVTAGMVISMRGQNQTSRVRSADRLLETVGLLRHARREEPSTMDFRTVHRLPNGDYEHRLFALSEEERSWWRRS